MKALVISALAALAIAPAISLADYHQPGSEAHPHRAEHSDGDYGHRGYDHRGEPQRMEAFKQRIEATHKAREALMAKTDACLDKAASPKAAKDCIKAERTEARAMHERMQEHQEARH